MALDALARAWSTCEPLGCPQGDSPLGGTRSRFPVGDLGIPISFGSLPLLCDYSDGAVDG